MDQVDIYKQLFLNASEGLILTDSRGAISEVNPRAEMMFGYPFSELKGEKIEILIPKEKRANHVGHREKYIANLMNRSMGIGMNLMALRKDGTKFPVEISLNHYGEGESLTVMALISDISKRVEIESKIIELNEQLEKRVESRTQEVLQSQNLYVAIARNFPDGTISVFDKNLNYVFFEGKELYQAGIESEKILGTSIKNRLPNDVKEKVIEHLNLVLNGSSGTIEFETKGQYFEFNGVPLKDRQGNINQILVVERNITKQKNAESEIFAALMKERALNELKSRFVSMASHEFRTPLSTILSSISLIDKYNSGEAKEKIQRHISRIKSSVQNLTGILNDFLSLDKLEEGKIISRSTELNIKELVEDILEEMEAILKPGQAIKVSYDCVEDKLRIDGQILKNILINLTSNAIKYSAENKLVQLSIQTRKESLVVVITDEGIGIPMEEQVHLFERFFRAKNVMNIEGTGLGLNIVKKYIELLEGHIEFRSDMGVGTTFTVKIPLKGDE